MSAPEPSPRGPTVTQFGLLINLGVLLSILPMLSMPYGASVRPYPAICAIFYAVPLGLIVAGLSLRGIRTPGPTRRRALLGVALGLLPLPLGLLGTLFVIWVKDLYLPP